MNALNELFREIEQHDVMRGHAKLIMAARREADAFIELAQAARIIFDVSDKAGIPGEAKTCPHGNSPHYPTHPWWCDECFGRLDDALSSIPEGIWNVSGAGKE